MHSSEISFISKHWKFSVSQVEKNLHFLKMENFDKMSLSRHLM